MLERLNPSLTGYTAVLTSEEGVRPLFGQVIHLPGNRSARLTFLLPEFSKEEEQSIPALIDHLAFQAGEMGALNLLAEIEEPHPLFELLRRGGFSVYSWESAWVLPNIREGSTPKHNWQEVGQVDESPIRNLFHTLVPPLVQHAEPFSNGSVSRLVHKVGNDVLAVVESVAGPNGIYLIPLIHPSVENVEDLLIDLVIRYAEGKKPIYLQVRSYQAWLSDVLTTIHAEPSPRFALMVKHLAQVQYSQVKANHALLSEQRRIEPTAPIIRNITDAPPHPKNSD